MSVKASKENQTPGNALATFSFAGIFDHGLLYAANSFWDPLTSQRIVYGWILEEDLPDGPRHRQGWSGMISLPRVVRLMTLHNVVKARSSSLESITSIEAIPDAARNTYTIHTLGISPEPRISLLRRGAQRNHIEGVPLLSSSSLSSKCRLPLKSPRWELQAEFAVGTSARRVGIELGHSEGELLPSNRAIYHGYSG